MTPEPGLPDKPAILYHYTTPEGLKGILQSGKLWATEVRYMNDASELDYALEFARQEPPSFSTSTRRPRAHARSSPDSSASLWTQVRQSGVRTSFVCRLLLRGSGSTESVEGLRRRWRLRHGV